MRKIRTKLTALIAIAILAVSGAAMGITAAATQQTTADVNGWNTTVTRGDAQAEAGHEIRGGDGFSTYTSLQDGDVITYGKKLKSPVMTDIVRTAPWRIDVRAAGTGSVTWKMDADVEGVKTTVFSGTWTLGGSIFSESTGISGLTADVPLLNSGDTLSLLFDGNYHTFGGGSVNLVSADGAIKQISSATTSMEAWINAGYPEEFDLSVTVSGTMDEVSVKTGEGLALFYLNGDWSRPADIFADGFANANDATFLGVKRLDSASPHLFDYFVFKGYESTFQIGVGTATKSPRVTVGGILADHDNDYDGKGSSYSYTVKIPADATDATLSVSAADYTVTYMNGKNKLRDTFIKHGDKANELNFEIPGKTVTGWYTDAELMQKFEFDTALSENTILYCATADTLVVNFKYGNELLSFKNVGSGQVIAPPAAPVKTGMTFDNWYADAEGTMLFDFSKPITATTDVFAVYMYNVEFKVLGFNGMAQKAAVPVKEGGFLTADKLPDFAELTGFPAFANIELEWYTDTTMKTKADFGENGMAINGSTTLIAAVTDKDIAVANGYVRPNEDGWDRNRGSISDSAGNVLTANQNMNNNGQYGSMTAITSADGTSDININYVGYIVNARKFDVTKPIYLSYTLDSRGEGIGTNSDGEFNHTHMQEFHVGLFNSLTGALVSQGQLHEDRFGTFASFGHRVNTDWQTNDSAGNGKLKFPYDRGAAIGDFVYAEKSQVELKIEIGADNTVIYQKQENNQTQENDWVSVGTLGATRDMYPDGMYLALETTRLLWISASATQESTATKGAVENGTFEMDEIKAGSMAGERVYFTAMPNAGYEFTESGLFAGGVNISVKYDEAKKQYYFNLPFGNNVITMGFGITVTFMSEGVQVGEPLSVVVGGTIGQFDTPANPVKTGHSFEGWYLDEDFESPVVYGETVFNAPATLYAKFKVASYTITYISNGTRLDSGTADYGATFTKIADPAREGYTFGGWFTDSAFTTAYDFSAAVEGNVTVYALWNEVEQGGNEGGNGNGGGETEKKGCGSSVAVTTTLFVTLALTAAAAMIVRKKSRSK